MTGPIKAALACAFILLVRSLRVILAYRRVNNGLINHGGAREAREIGKGFHGNYGNHWVFWKERVGDFGDWPMDQYYYTVFFFIDTIINRFHLLPSC